MLFGMYSIYDKVAQTYNTPFFQTNDQVAVRSFRELAADATSSLYRSPSDYQLIRIGAFDSDDGQLLPEDHQVLAQADNFRKEVK